MDNAIGKQPLRLEPRYRDYVWGGNRLRPETPGPTAEAWVVYEGNTITSGPASGRTLKEVAAELGEAVLGSRVVQRGGARFPLLIKLLDCADWLSVQVHPNDEQALRLEGPGHNGKTEAWHIIEADAGAELLCGLKPGADREVLAEAIRRGEIMRWINRLEVHAGDSVLIKAGMVHALGPGMFLYEVQQTSDITYRVYDWDRPMSEGRQLHIDKALAVINPDLQAYLAPGPELENGQAVGLVESQYFLLRMLSAASNSVELDTGGESFHAITMIEGTGWLSGPGWEVPLEPWKSAVIPAGCGLYHFSAEGKSRALLAQLPE